MLATGQSSPIETVKGLNKNLSRKRSDSFDDDQFLFEAPSDLVCPITHELFRDPVINAVGQVYERDAIVSHLRRATPTDPVSMVRLTNTDLTPVFPMRSRALEYRERVAKQSVDISCRLTTRDPVRYLRRACEMCWGVDVRVPGLCPEVIQYIQSHSSNAYDTAALELFADGLQKSGYIDQAANVYCSLLTRGEDRSRQAEVLKKCFKCWSTEDSDLPGMPAVAKLAHFIETQDGVTAAHVIELMVAANISTSFILSTCEFLLSKWSSKEVDKLQVKYVQLNMHAMKECLVDLQRQLNKLQQAEQGASQVQQLSHEESQPAQAAAERKKQRRLIASVALAAVSLVGRNNLACKVAQLVPLFYLLGTA